MGKATIESGGNEGYYTVTLKMHRGKIDREITRLNGLIQTMQQIVDKLNLDYQLVINLINEMLQEQNQLIETYVANPTDDEVKKALSEQAERLSRAALLRAKTQGGLEAARLEKLGYEKKLAELQAIELDPEVQIWCADCTEDLSGDVGVIEPDQEPGRPSIIQPGYSGDAGHNAERDGQIAPVMALDPVHAFGAQGALPAWQRWKPRYRVGTIMMIDYDAHNCTVVIDPATSSQQNLPITQEPIDPIGVPIDYMFCQSHPFRVGDRVLVMFTGQDWGQPKVIGFESHPRPCCPAGFRVIPTSSTGSLPPHTLALWQGQWIAQRADACQAGNIDWTDGEDVISWNGPAGRNVPLVRAFSLSGSALIWMGGRVIAEAPGVVAGACLRTINNVRHVVCITDSGAVHQRWLKNGNNEIWSEGNPGGWYQLGQQAGDPKYRYYKSPWFFNASGTEASTMRCYERGGTRVSSQFGTSTYPLVGLARLTCSIGADSASFTEIPGDAFLVRYVGSGGVTGTPLNGTQFWQGAYRVGETPIEVAVDYRGDEKVIITYIYSTEQQQNQHIRVWPASTGDPNGESRSHAQRSFKGQLLGGGINLMLVRGDGHAQYTYDWIYSEPLEDGDGLTRITYAMSRSGTAIDTTLYYLDARYGIALMQRSEQEGTWHTADQYIDGESPVAPDAMAGQVRIRSEIVLVTNGTEDARQIGSRVIDPYALPPPTIPDAINYAAMEAIEAGTGSLTIERTAVDGVADEGMPVVYGTTFQQNTSQGHGVAVSPQEHYLASLRDSFSGAYHLWTSIPNPAGLVGLSGADQRFYPLSLL